MATRLIDVCDREADFFAMFDEQRRDRSVELLVRAKHNRNITEDPLRLWEAVRQTRIESQGRCADPRQSARPKKSKPQARAKRPARNADLAFISTWRFFFFFFFLFFFFLCVCLLTSLTCGVWFVVHQPRGRKSHCSIRIRRRLSLEHFVVNIRPVFLRQLKNVSSHNPPLAKVVGQVTVFFRVVKMENTAEAPAPRIFREVKGSVTRIGLRHPDALPHTRCA